MNAAVLELAVGVARSRRFAMATLAGVVAVSAVAGAFALHPNRALGRDRLLELAHGRDHEATDRSIDVQVMRLRRMIEADPAEPRHIQTVWGVGYVFVPEGGKAAHGPGVAK